MFMVNVRQFRELRAEINTYECACFEDLRLFSYHVIAQIRKLSGNHEGENSFFNNYISQAILPGLGKVEEFIKLLEAKEDQIEFKVRTLKYYFQFIIDSCIYSIMMNYKNA